LRKKLPKIWMAFLLLASLSAGGRAQTWERLGPEGGLVVSLGASAAGTLYLGTADGHVFVKEQSAKKWELRGRVGGRTDAVVTRLLGDPRHETRVYAAVWYQDPRAGGGVFRTDDAGVNWKLIGLGDEAVRALEMAPSDADELIAGTRTGVFRSQDAGKTWERISPAGDEELRNLDSLAIDPRDPNTIYAGTYHLPWKTTDGGKSWKPVVAGLIDDSDIMSLRIDASDPARVYLSACSGIYRSETRAEQWTKLQGIPYSARRTQAIVQDPAAPRTLYGATTEGLWVTRDGGESWRRTTPGDWVVNAAVVVPGEDANKEMLVIGTEAQGVLMSRDAGETFTASNEGFTHTVVKQLVGAWHDPQHLAMILHRNGQELWESGDAGMSWTPLQFAPAGDREYAKLTVNDLAQIYGSPWGWLARSRDGRLWLREQGRAEWTERKLLLRTASRRPPSHASRTKRSAAAVALTVSDASVSFTANALWAQTGQGAMKCEPGKACVPLAAFGKNSGVAVLLAKADERTICAISNGKSAFSYDGGKTAVWRDLPSAGSAIKWMDVGATGDTILLGTSHGLFSSSDQGKTWTAGGPGLPSVAMDKYLITEELLMLTSLDGALYLSRDQGQTWQRGDGDAARGRFSGLAQAGGEMIVAGSQSEGVLRLKLPAEP